MQKIRWFIALMLVTLVMAACAAPAAAPADGGSDDSAAETTGESAVEPAAELTPVRLQLQWVTQSQFAGYYAAKELGFYEEEGLDVTILEGAVEIVPQQVVAAGDAQFGVAWVPKMLASRERARTWLTSRRSSSGAAPSVSWADSGLESPEDWAGKRIGTWGFGNEWELYAALRQAGIEPDDPNQVTIVQQPFDMSLLLNREVDAAQAMIYNEYAQVLEATNPETGELYQPEDLTVIDYNDVGTAMLQDHVFARGEWLEDEANQDIAERFLRATFRGWIHCRDNVDECVDIVLDNGPTLGEGHMRWQLNEINALIWPSPNGIGVMDDDLYQQTVDISVDFAVLSAAPDDAAVRTDLAEAALAGIEDVDTTGEGFEKLEVEVTPGGE
ncbi:MAG: ABC transporter substrate-binding protein [Caldilineaceae bacterium]|nr:ABC transporter substrate-binding protein [Caldilineaceae bacterium]